jgi:uroporphyrin-III C-methyltransferase/precorrin-2 dehydrogenase/sirohydrochlorin ferrochelatase
LQYLTGHGANGGLPPDIDWVSLADPVATTVVYMPTRTLAQLVERAVLAGLDPATPSVAVARATLSDQEIARAPIAELPARLAATPLSGPVTVMIGQVFAGVGGSAAVVSIDGWKHAAPAAVVPTKVGTQ